MTRGMLNLRGTVTFLLGGVYLGSLVWALVHGQLDVNSFIAGIGPSFGYVTHYWFNQESRVG